MGVPEDSRAARSRADSFDTELITEENLAKVRALDRIAAGRGQSLAQLALAWTLRDDRVTSALIGASSVSQLESNVAALERFSFAGTELEEIERYATEGGVNLWRPPDLD